MVINNALVKEAGAFTRSILNAMLGVNCGEIMIEMRWVLSDSKDGEVPSGVTVGWNGVEQYILQYREVSSDPMDHSNDNDAAWKTVLAE